MENSAQLANRFREVTLNGKWIAYTNFKEQLTDVTLFDANKKVADLNTIALLTFHINYFVAGVLNVFEGGNLEIKDALSFDMPKLTSEAEWNTLKQELFDNSEKFANYIESFSDKKLNSVFVDEKYGTYRRNIEAMIEHSYYHLGQIVLIKKLL